MKILYIPGYRYPENLQEPLTSGDLRYSFTLSRSLAKLGHEVSIITRKNKGDKDVSHLDGVNIHRYSSELSKIFSTSFDISINRYKLFKKLMKDTDLLICNSPLSLELTIKTSIPIIYIASGLEDIKNYSFAPKEIIGFVAIKLLRDPFKRKTWKRSRIVNTTAIHEDTTLIKWGVPKNKIGKISSSVDLNRFMPLEKQAARTRNELNISLDDRIILNVSRFTPAKGIVETVRAFDKLETKKTKLVIAGVHHSHDNTYFLKLREEIAQAKKSKNIILIENIPEDSLPALYSAANVVSVFSKGYDPLPTVIIESMACGTPVVSTYYKTREQFIKDTDNGLFVEEQNLDDWVAKISQVLKNDVVARRMSKNALKHVRRNFDSTKIAKDILRTTNI